MNPRLQPLLLDYTVDRNERFHKECSYVFLRLFKAHASTVPSPSGWRSLDFVPSRILFVRPGAKTNEIILALAVFDSHQPKQLVTLSDRRRLSDRLGSVTISQRFPRRCRNGLDASRQRIRRRP
jgi:hypothetical protein